MGNDKSRKFNKIVYLTLALLLVAVAILAFLNRGDAELRRALEENREFHIRINGEHAATIGLQALLDMYPQEFTTSFATSVAPARDTVLRGVEMRLLFEAAGIDISQASHFIVSGLDSYYSPLTRAEVEKEDVIYICYMMDGKLLEPQSKGGFGPFLMVIRGERFAQRWCKYVEAVDVILTND